MCTNILRFAFPPFLLGQVAQIKHFDWLKVVDFWGYSTAVTCSTCVVEIPNSISRKKKCLSGFPNVIYLLTFTMIKGLQAAYMTRPFILKMIK